MKNLKTIFPSFNRKVELLAYLAICGAALMLPFQGKATTILLLLFASLLLGSIKRMHRDKDRIGLFVPMVLLYVCYCIGMLYSENLAFGFFDLEIKASLVALPLLFVLVPAYTPKQVRGICVGFIIGCFIACIVCIYQAVGCYEEIQHRACFSSSRLSSMLHPSYFSMYLCLAILMLLYNWYAGYWRKKKVITFMILFLVAFFSAFIIQVAAKSGLISLGVSLFMVFAWIAAGRGRWMQTTALFAITLSALITAALLIPTTRERIDNMVHAFGGSTTVSDEDGSKPELESTKSRVLIWKASLDIASKNLFGVGTGDIKDVLIANYEDRGWTAFSKQQTNPHNQFLQTWLAIGIPGVLSLMLWVALTIRQGWRCRHFILLAFGVLFAINMLTESILETQGGVLFITFFMVLLGHNYGHYPVKRQRMYP